MNILILSYEFPPLVGGAGTYALELAIGLNRLHCEVEVITCYHNNTEYNDKFDHELFKKNRIYITRFKALSKLYFLQLHKNIIKKYSNNYHEKFDYIFLADARATRYAVLFMSDIQLSKSVHIFHGSEIDSFLLKPSIQSRLSGIRKKLILTLLKSKASITVSAEFKRMFLENVPEINGKIYEVLHGIDDKVFKPIDENEKISTRKQYGFKTDDLIIISASRLVKLKGQDNLIKAFAPLALKYPKTKLVIAGDGEYRKELEKISKRLNLEEHVYFVGNLTREQLSKLLASCDLFSMISRFNEAFGIVYIEANACGLPVLAGDISGVREAVEEGVSGLLVDPFDIEDIKNKLESMLDKKLLVDLGNSAFNRFKKGFTCKHMAENTLKILQNNN